MGNSREVKAIITADASNFQKGTGKAVQSSTTLEKALGKLGPVGKIAQNLLDKIGLSSVTAGAGLAGAAAAALGVSIAIAEKAIDRYVQLGIAIRSYSYVTGQSAEDSSRQVEAFDKLGVSEDVAQAAMFRLAKTAEETPAKLDKVGVSIQKNADGTINLGETLLNVMRAYQGTSDAGQRAAIVYSAFGKGGQAMVPILETNIAELQRLEATVGKVYTAADLDRVRQYQIAQKELQQSQDEWALNLGQALLPAQKAVYDSMNENVYVSKHLDDATKKLAQGNSEGYVNTRLLSASLREQYREAQTARDRTDELAKSAKDAADAAKAQADAEDALYNELHKSTDANFALEQANIDLKKAQETVKNESDKDQAAVNKVTDAYAKLNEAIKKYGPASRQAADAQVAVRAAQDAAAGSSEQAVEDNLRLREAYVKVADAAVAQAEATAGVEGRTLSATEKADIYRQALQDQANLLAPNSPLRRQLQGYIDELNSIPSSKTTYINVTGSSAAGAHAGGHGIQSFDGGGVVPGMTGAPVLAEVHGKEAIFTPEQLKALAAGGSHSQGDHGPEMVRLLASILKELQTKPTGQTGVEAALYKAVALSGVNRARGMVGG